VINRVLVAPLNYSHRQVGQIEAFRRVFGDLNVLEVDWWREVQLGNNPGAVLVEAARVFKPDWVWLQIQGSDSFPPVSLDRLREAVPGCYVTHWMGDCRAKVPDTLADICRRTHATLISNVGQGDMYKKAGAPRVHYVQIGLDPEDLVDTGPPPFKVPDVVFIGNYYGHVTDFAEGNATRLATVRELAADPRISVGVVGAGWPKDVPVVGTCHVKQQHAVYSRAKVALSINHFNTIDRYYSDRHLIAMASGTPVVAKYVPGLELEFEPDVECVMANSPREILYRVETLLADDQLRGAIGLRGSVRALKDHTWYERIHRLRPLVEEWRNAL
jgi:spore maturation protein CgeB